MYSSFHHIIHKGKQKGNTENQVPSGDQVWNIGPKDLRNMMQHCPVSRKGKMIKQEPAETSDQAKVEPARVDSVLLVYSLDRRGLQERKPRHPMYWCQELGDAFDVVNFALVGEAVL
jgi:hypothetical protein